MSSGMWYRTLVYLGLKEEPETGYDELPERYTAPAADADTTGGGHARFDPVDDPDLRLERSVPRASARHEDGVSNVRQLRVPQGDEVRLAVIEIGGFDDVERVGARYRDGQPVLFDVSAAERADARRVIDFVAGLTYALHGRLHRVGTRAFLLVPDGVELPPRETERLRTLGYRVPAGGAG